MWLARLAALCFAATPVCSAHAASCATALPGANVAGGEFNAGAQPGKYGFDYVYPGKVEIDLLKQLDLKLMRMPVLWERIQRAASGPLDENEMTRLDTAINLAAANGITTILDVHNYGGYRGVSLGKSSSPSSALPNLWRNIAERYRGNPNVVFGMMNEPNDMSADAWAAIAKQTLDAIRSIGSRNLVLIPGTNWDGAHSWFTPIGARSNADALLPLARNDALVAFEVHQYFDDNFSGTAETCTGAARVPQALTNIATWARTNHVKLFLGEFGVSVRAECVKALDDALAVIERDKDIWYGWTYWAAGAWWGTYPFNIQTSGGDTPQGRVLKARANALTAPAC